MKMLNELANVIYLGNKSKGFWDQERNVGELLMLITSELGEAMEAHRKGKFADVDVVTDLEVIFDKDTFENNVKDTFEDEVADALIRILDMCGGLGIDIEAHVNTKLKYNATRERLHGKNY
jgi:NTP pyrophosphatase (non-canonical NTP hydrolase)